MQRQRNFRGHEVADEYAKRIGNTLADLAAILRIQAYPPPPV